MTRGFQLYVPSQVAVEVDPEGMPREVEGIAVDGVNEEWLVEDRWWTLPRLWRHYFELILADGRSTVVFRTSEGRWFRQRA